MILEYYKEQNLSKQQLQPRPHFKKIYIFGSAGSSLLRRLFSSCGKWGLLSSCGERASHWGGFSGCRAWALGTQASVVVAHWLQSSGSIHSCGTQTQLPHSMWNFLEPGIKPVSPALAGEFLTIGPPGKSQQQFLKCSCDSLISAIFNVFSYVQGG